MRSPPRLLVAMAVISAACEVGLVLIGISLLRRSTRWRNAFTALMVFVFAYVIATQSLVRWFAGGCDWVNVWNEALLANGILWTMNMGMRVPSLLG